MCYQLRLCHQSFNLNESRFAREIKQNYNKNVSYLIFIQILFNFSA